MVAAVVCDVVTVGGAKRRSFLSAIKSVAFPGGAVENQSLGFEDIAASSFEASS